ncbi:MULTISPECIES: hypothetical protein [Streptomyces]|uniref:hypothetical protein n=1 Tax=Streptomyces TaxID=1883 RepID=UPI00240D358B|nr:MULTISPECIES: hypothetical protein [Streptomyces]WFB88570.1 hypothetical protein MMU79_37700 [Streptomyces olivaceus]WGK50711.1 hypothetical protein M6G09_36725 [Streptomyces sp. B146]
MIHDDSTGARGKGFKDLISGIRQLVSIGAGDGWRISLIGGSSAGTSAYLRRPENLPRATIHDLGESEGAYITETGLVASSKRRLARSLQVADIAINALGGGMPDTAPTASRMFGSNLEVSVDRNPVNTGHEIDAKIAEPDGQRPDPVADSEKQALIERIANEFGVRMDSSAGLKAVKGTAPGASQDEMDKVQPLRWERHSLEQVYAALKHYAPVLGPQRAHSNRAGSDQELEAIGSVTSGLVDQKTVQQLAGAYFKHFRLVNIYKSGHKVDRLGSDSEWIQLNSVAWVASHEMAHGLLNYALRDFTKNFWEGVEPPLAVDGYVASSPEEDFREAIRLLLQGPREELRFALRAPRHAKAMGALRARLPEAFAQRSGESQSDAAARIAEELKDELSWFMEKVNTTWTPRGDRYFGKEEPISAYAKTNADEDLAETAMYFFNDRHYLWKHAPERAQFINDLVASWTKVPDTYSEDHPTTQHVGNTVAHHTSAQGSGARDGRPRFVVRSGFDVRRFSFGGEQVTDLTVRLSFRGGEGEREVVRRHVQDGVEALLNGPSHRLPNGDRLHVTVEYVDASDDPHLTVNLVSRDREMDQSVWWVDAGPARLAHELTHQLGLRDEYRDAAPPHRTHLAAGLLGALDEKAEDVSFAAGLRDRHLNLIGALVGEVTPHTAWSEQSWESARAAADPVLRQAVWAGPVSPLSETENSDERASGSRVGADGLQGVSLPSDGTGRRRGGADMGSATVSGAESEPDMVAFLNEPEPPPGDGAAETAPAAARSATVDGASSGPADVVDDVLRLRAMASSLLEFHARGTGAADLRSHEGVRRLEEAFLGDAQAQLIIRLLQERSPDGAGGDAAARSFVREWLARHIGTYAGLPEVDVRSVGREADTAPEEEIGADLFDVRGHGVGTGDLFVSESGLLVHADGPRLQHADVSADFAVNNTHAFVTRNDPVHRTGEFAAGWTSGDVKRAAVQVLEAPEHVVPDLENPGRSIRSGTVDGVSIDVTVTTGGKIASVRRSHIVHFDPKIHVLSWDGERNLSLIADRLAALVERNDEAGFPRPLVTVRSTGTWGGPLALADTRRIDAVGAYLERAARVIGIDLNVVRRTVEISALQSERFGPHVMAMLRRQVVVTIDSHAAHVGRRAIRLLDGQTASDRRRKLTDLFPMQTPRPAPAPIPVSAGDQARIAYSEAAQDFERRLGAFLVHHPPVVQFVHDLIGRMWNLVEDEAPHLLTRFGTRDPHRAGAVGDDLSVLRSTMESGNLREQMAMLWNGHDNNLFDELFDRISVYPVEIEIERQDRRAVADVNAVRQLPIRESDIVPPLSHRERAFSGVPDSDAVVWRPAPTVIEYSLESDLQLSGSRTGALISTGISGSTYFLLSTAEDLSIRIGTPIRMDLMRLALLGTLLTTRTHTFHEVMSSAQLWDAEGDGLYELGYTDNWGRYRLLDPIDEETLRREVARDGLFPDEIALNIGTPEDARHSVEHPSGIPARVQPEKRPRKEREQQTTAESAQSLENSSEGDGLTSPSLVHQTTDAGVLAPGVDDESRSERDGLTAHQASSLLLQSAWDSGENRDKLEIALRLGEMAAAQALGDTPSIDPRTALATDQEPFPASPNSDAHLAEVAPVSGHVVDAHLLGPEPTDGSALRRTGGSPSDVPSSGDDFTRPAMSLQAGPEPDAEIPVPAAPGASVGVVSALSGRVAPEGGRLAALRDALRPDLIYSVRLWGGSFDEEVARLHDILEEGGSRSIVFGNWDEAPVWVVKMSDTNSLEWFDRHFQPLSDGPSFAHGPVASIDISHLGVPLAPSRLGLRHLDGVATERIKTTYCDIGPGYDLTRLFTRSVPW